MGRSFDQQIVITDRDIKEEEVTRKDQLTQDLIHAWDVAVEKRALPIGMVQAELIVNEVVYDLLGSLPRLLA